MPAALETPPHVVWTRKHVATDVCPQSFITAQSIGWIEEFLVWKRLGLNLTFDLGARQAEAFIILEEQLSMEKQNGV